MTTRHELLRLTSYHHRLHRQRTGTWSRLARQLLTAVAVALLCVSASRADVRVEAYRGEPFGIGRVTIELPPGASSAPASDDRITLTESSDRVLYPSMKSSGARKILRDFLGIETPRRTTFVFMFRGDDPLDLVVYTPQP